MRQPHVVGLDTGLTCTGLATAGCVMRTAKIGQIGVTKLPLAQRTKAIVDLGGAVIRQCYLSASEAPDVSDWWRKPDLVVMEAPDVSRGYGGLVERIQLYHEIARTLADLGVPYATVPSPVLKGYATGNGGVDPKKARVKAAVAKLWPEYGALGEINDDQADGGVLAGMGLDWLTGQRRVPEAQSTKWLHHKSNQWASDVRWAG